MHIEYIVSFICMDTPAKLIQLVLVAPGYSWRMNFYDYI